MDIWWTPGGHLKDIFLVVMDGVVVMDTSSTSVVVMDIYVVVLDDTCRYYTHDALDNFQCAEIA